MEELKPCPFCGNFIHTIEQVGDELVVWIKCKTCGATGPASSSKQQAIDAWNRRPQC